MASTFHISSREAISWAKSVEEAPVSGVSASTRSVLTRRRRQDVMPGGWLWLLILILLVGVLYFTMGFGNAGQVAISYKIYRCWVSEYQALPELDANAHAVAIEHMVLQNEGWERDVAVSEPKQS